MSSFAWLCILMTPQEFITRFFFLPPSLFSPCRVRRVNGYKCSNLFTLGIIPIIRKLSWDCRTDWILKKSPFFFFCMRCEGPDHRKQPRALLVVTTTTRPSTTTTAAWWVSVINRKWQKQVAAFTQGANRAAGATNPAALQRFSFLNI